VVDWGCWGLLLTCASIPQALAACNQSLMGAAKAIEEASGQIDADLFLVSKLLQATHLLTLFPSCPLITPFLLTPSYPPAPPLPSEYIHR